MSEVEANSPPEPKTLLIKGLEADARPVAERITESVVGATPESSGRATERYADLVFSATHSALWIFIDRNLGRDPATAGTDDLFRKLGYREGAHGRGGGAIERALRTAKTEIWDELRRRAADHGLSAGALNEVHESVNSYLNHLGEQLSVGYRTGTQARNQDVGVARSRLLTGLLAGSPAEEIEMLAAVARWEVPDRVTVLAIAVHPNHPYLPATMDGQTLTLPAGAPQPLICHPDALDDALSGIRLSQPNTRVAVCWEVPAGDVPEAWTWSTRALDLVRARVIPARPVIECARHRTEIWLHAEPVLRRQLAQELLQPLFAETENSREILSETLLVWLETRDSAPAIAAKLGVHPQTVRYRWKRINELFGDSLHDPDFVTQLLLVLKASVPLWIAGDQSDFKRFASRRAAEEAQVDTESVGEDGADG